MGNADSNEAGTLRDGDAPAPGMPPSLFDAEGTIVTDLSCRRCSYNLRGLTNDRRCPECGTPVGLSTHGNLLRYADPDWVERLSRGGKLIMQALTAWVLTVIVMACGGIAAVPMLMELGASSMLGVLVRLLVTLWMMVVMAALYYGVWLITAPDPSRVGEDQYATSRRLTRIGVLAGAVQMVTHRLSELYIWSSGIGILLAVLTVITFVVLIVGVLAYLRYLQQLALRIPDEALSQRGRTLFWLLLVLVAAPVMLVGLAAFAMAATVSGAGSSAGMGVFGGLMIVGTCSTMLFGLVLFLVYARWQDKLRLAFSAQAKIARETWAAAQAAGNETPVTEADPT